MRHSSAGNGDGTVSFQPLWKLVPYLWPHGRRDLRLRVVFSVVCLVLAKVATVYMPIFFGESVDSLSGSVTNIVLTVPVMLIVAYVVARIAMQGFAQLRDGLFAPVAYHALREVGVQTFSHMHTLSLRFHLDRKTGGLARVIERGTRGIDVLLGFAIFSIFPTILEFLLVAGIMAHRFGIWYAVVTIVMVGGYSWFTLAVTKWRIQFRRDMNDSDTDAGTKTVDSLLNYETVKYFGNERHETRRFNRSMTKFANASIQSRVSLSLLNSGQAVIIAVGLGILMVMAACDVKSGRMTVGDLVMVNAYMVQLYVPLNLLGTVYREITQALVDMGEMFGLLEQHQEVKDKPDAPPLQIRGGDVCFENVEFSYNPNRKVLKGISFNVPAGQTVAIVGPSGAGKSTISRILFRFYDIQSGRVMIDGQDIRDVQQASLRAAIGIVPQDTVLFNDTVGYNIAYGRIDATQEEVIAAAKAAQIDKFIRLLSEGYDTMVGERGLKLSGGEKQRVAIARTILKNPPILLLDEATSALDTGTEREIQTALAEISKNRTTLVIAHRLSTVIDADQILVLDHGEIVEHGRHEELLAKNGAYATMWNKQKAAAEAREKLEVVENDPDVSPDIAKTRTAEEV